MSRTAAFGSSTCSSTPWHSRRSAEEGPTTAARAPASPCSALTRTGHAGLGRAALERGERVGAGVDDDDAVAEPGERHGEAAGAAADVDDVQRAPVTGLAQQGVEDAPDDGRPDGLARIGAGRPAATVRRTRPVSQRGEGAGLTRPP